MLGAVVVFGTLRLPFVFMTGLFALILFGAALEWAQLAGFASRTSRLIYSASTVGAALACALLLRGPDMPVTAMLALGCSWWCAAAVWVVHYQRHAGPKVTDSAGLALCGWLALIPALAALLTLLDRGPASLLALFALVWGADIFAYFGGKTFGGKIFGKRRLASRVSPGKTWEGLTAALLGTQLLTAAAASVFKSVPLPALLALAAVTLAASLVGDLFESLLKRLRGVKDSGNLLPGHGGLLDRIDSLLAAAPVFTLGLILMEQS